jgi:hypothetical protein
MRSLLKKLEPHLITGIFDGLGRTRAARLRS